MPAAIQYPAGPISPHGLYHVLKGDEPMVSLLSHNDNVVFWLMGGFAHADPTRPESVQISRDGLTGLIAPWQTIDQRGATEDGVTFVDALYDPMEVTVTAVVRGRDAAHTRRVARHLIESIDVHQCAELGWMTHELGYWWATVRWFKNPPNSYSGIPTRQEWPLVLRTDSGFWQSYPDIDQFGFDYADMVDEFGTEYASDLGPNWPQRYDGDGGGYHYVTRGSARWRDDPNDTWVTKSREVINGPYKDFHTATDNQVVEWQLGVMPEWSLGGGGSNDGWARMNRNPDGTWAGDGIRARVSMNSVEVTGFVNYAPVWSRVVRGRLRVHGRLFRPIIPFIDDRWQLICGYDDDPRMFKVLRDGAPVLTFKEPGTASQISSDHRGVGCGARAGGALITQATPGTLRRFAAGDNAVASQSGFLRRCNAGDQQAYDEYTFYGPAEKFAVANGPGSTEMVEFGPLGVGEIAHIRTDPRRKEIFDYTNTNPDPIAPALFGASPSDTLYRKLNGRFTAACAIPAKQPGMRVETHMVACSITGGNADSRILAQLTPLRRYPD